MSINHNLTSDDNSTTHYELTGHVSGQSPQSDPDDRVTELNQQLDQVKQITIDNIAAIQTVRVVNNCEAKSPKYLDKYPIIVPNNGKKITAYSI